MNDIKYELTIYCSEQDSAFIVVVSGLSGCKADGGTYAVTIANAGLVFNDWIVLTA